METLERIEKAKLWDKRTPIECYRSLTRQEQTAFNAFFRGAWRNLQLSWRADTEKFLPPSFGKAECEWVALEFWKYKLTGLRFIEWHEEPPKIAGSVFVSVKIVVTDDGLEAYEQSSATPIALPQGEI